MDCESRPAEQWKAMKNLFPWITAYHLTRHGCTDPSHSFRMTTDAFLIMTPYRPRSFWTGTRIPYEKGREAGQWHRVKNLLLWWRLAVFLTTVIDPSHSFRMTFYREYRFYQTKGCWKFGTWKKNLHSNPSCHSLERVSSNHCISDEECFMYNSF